MKKIILSNLIKYCEFMILSFIAGHSFAVGNKDAGFIFWIWACTRLIISEMKDK